MEAQVLGAWVGRKQVARLCVHRNAGVDVPRVARHSSLDWIASKELSAHLSRLQDKLSAMFFFPELERYLQGHSRYINRHGTTGGSGASFPWGNYGDPA